MFVLYKNKPIKCAFSLVLTVFLISILTCSVLAYNYPPLLDDSASLLSSGEAEEISASLERVSEKYNFDVVIVTNDSLGYKSAEAFADDYYDENGYGRDEDFSGILFLVSMGERDWAISTCGLGTYYFGDNDIDAIADNVLGFLSDGNYASAFETYISCVEDTLEYYATHDGYTHDDYYNGYGNSNDYSIREERYQSESIGIGNKIIVSLVIGAIVGFVSVGAMKSSMKTVRYNSAASNYVVRDSLNVRRANEFFLYRNVSRTPRQTEQSRSQNRGGHSGGSIHTSSSGRSHGGRSGKF